MPKRIKDQNTYIHGSHNELCDVCGFKFKTEDMHTRWDGLRTCHDDFEERHPMDFFRGFPDNQNVNDPDADDTDNSGVNTTLPSVSGTVADQDDVAGATISALDTSTAFTEGDGTPTYTATNLPGGLVIDSSTGIITGTIDLWSDISSPYTVTITLETTASAVFEVSTTFTWTVNPSQSLLVNWVAQAGSPTVSGPVYITATANVAVSDQAASTIDLSTDTGQYYAEFEITDEGTTDLEYGFGWKRSAAITNVGTSQMLGGFWQTPANIWRVNRETLGQNQLTFDVQEAAPVPGTIIGVAIDSNAGLLYINMNGNWQTSNSGTTGGAPGVGPGWTILNSNQVMWLYSYAEADNATYKAVTPQFTPTGYTPVT